MIFPQMERISLKASFAHRESYNNPFPPLGKPSWDRHDLTLRFLRPSRCSARTSTMVDVENFVRGTDCESNAECASHCTGVDENSCLYLLNEMLQEFFQDWGWVLLGVLATVYILYNQLRKWYQEKEMKQFQSRQQSQAREKLKAARESMQRWFNETKEERAKLNREHEIEQARRRREARSNR